MTRNRIGSRTARLHLEHLEDRTVPSTFTVNTALDDVTPANGKFSLREAITKANTTAGADVIVLPAGVFKISQTGAEVNPNDTLDFDITHTVTIQGAGAGKTIIDGQQLDRVFDVLGTAPSSIKVMVQGLTIRNGKVIGEGGGIRVGNADLVVRDSVVSGNRASLTGGGISNGATPGTGKVTVIRTTLALNVAGMSGGGLYISGTSVLTGTDSTIRRNLASGSGGGIVAITATLTNCTVSGNSASIGGGISATTVTLTNCTVSGNSADFAGGITANTATLSNCTVSGNSAVNNGGGVIAGTTATLTNCTVSGNSAGGVGGGIVIGGTGTLSNCTVSGNHAGDAGGGINATTITLTSCTISGNSAGNNGGGINADTASLTKSTLSGNSSATSGGGIFVVTSTLTNCTISGNSASSFGGGIDAFSTATLTNCTISGNSAGGNGGGMVAITATLLNCTIVENHAHIGGGLFRDGSGTFSIKNTIVALNLTDFSGSGPDVSGAFTSQGHNLIGDGTGGTGFTNGTNGDFVGTNVDPIDPKLGPLANNGGKTKTHALLAGSLAIDHGDNSLLPSTDQRGVGFARRKDGNGDGLVIVDIGAFER